MIEPEVTAVLGRRYVALLLDSSLVAATGLGVAYQQSEAFAVVGRDSTDAPLVDPGEFERMRTLLDFTILGRSDLFGVNIVRAQEIGGSVRVFAADSYRMGLIAAALAAAIVFFAVPALISRTPGMLPLNLTIRDTDGAKPGVGAHLARSAMGVIDMFPGFVPGLLGMMAAYASPRHQRFGDRVAGTVVVDRTVIEFTTSHHEGAPLEIPIEAPDPSADVSARGRHTPEPSTEPAPAPEPVRDEVAIAPPERDIPAEPEPAPEPSKAPRLTGDPLPPPPVHRKVSAEKFVGVAEAAPTSALDPTRQDEPRDEADNEIERHTETFTTEQWAPPRVEPAPVWQPTPLEPAKIEAPDPHDGRTLEDVALAEPSVGELLGRVPVNADDGSGAGRDEPTSRQGGSVRAPVWSDKWRAWMYWDSAARCWLRHDTESNTWTAVE